MVSSRIVVFFLLSSLGFWSCVSFKTQTLYTGVEAEVIQAKPSSIAQLVEPVIFKDDLTDVWGIETTVCKEAVVSEQVKVEGKRAIKIAWDRGKEGCVWAGIGIGWDSYAGKDLSELIPYAAIQLHVRAVKERMFGLPMVLTLEDYSGGMGFAYTGNKYFERSFIDTSWQKVIVPLEAFDMEIENLDPTNIKQIMFELQQGGAIYIDDIELVFYEEPEQVAWYVEEELPDPTKLPIALFKDGFINGNGWGLMKDACRDIAIVGEASGKGKVLAAKWNEAEDCGSIQVGVSWNKWFPIDMSALGGVGHFQLTLKQVDGPTKGTIEVQLQDYNGASSSPFVIDVAAVPESLQTITIPLSSISEKLDFTNVKQAILTFRGTGSVEVKEWKIVK